MAHNNQSWLNKLKDYIRKILPSRRNDGTTGKYVETFIYGIGMIAIGGLILSLVLRKKIPGAWLFNLTNPVNIVTILVFVSIAAGTIYLLRKKKYTAAILTFLISLIVLIGLEYTYIRWKEGTITFGTPGSKQGSSRHLVQVVQAIKPTRNPGPNLKWGENKLTAGTRYPFYRTVSFRVYLLSAWHEGLDLDFHKVTKEGEPAVYWRILFSTDKSSFVDETTKHDDGSHGEFYFIPDEDMIIDIVP